LSEFFQNNRIASLDLMRGVAAFVVACAHFFMANEISPFFNEIASIIAVEVFFILSGFVLAPQIINLAHPQGHRGLIVFLSRRWLRTIPLYIFSLSLMAVLSSNLFTSSFWEYLFYLQNFYKPLKNNDFYSIAWSLSVEEWFYIIFPLYLMGSILILRLKPSKLAILKISIIFCIIISILRILIGNYENWGESIRRVVLFRLDSIAYGIILFILLHKILFIKVKNIIYIITN